MAALCVAEELSKLHARRGARHEIEQAVRDAESLGDEGMTWRLGQAAEARNRAERAQTEDRAEFDTAPNGMKLERSLRKESLSLFDSLLKRESKDSP